MRILLDECIDEALRFSFIDHDCQTCRYANLTGLANGELLAAAEQAGFDALVTVDQNMQYQQNFRDRAIAVLILQARSTNIDDLLVLIPDVLRVLETLIPSEVIRIRMNPGNQ